MNKVLRLFDSQVKEINENEKSITALVSTAAWDRQDEVLLPEGANFKNFRKNPVVMWAHDYSKPPIGRAAWIKNTADGILAKTIFADTPFAQEIFGLYKGGFMKAFSIGFIPKAHDQGDGDKKPRRTYTDWEVIEYSAVPVPCNPEALALAMQKGMISDEVKKYLEDYKVEPEAEKETEEEKPEVPETKNINQMEIIEPLQKEMAQDKEKIKQLTEEVGRLTCELLKAKGDLFTARVELLNVVDATKSDSGISGDDLVKTINEILTREVRKAQGKLD
jgi:HK97 family phage prohead protease